MNYLPHKIIYEVISKSTLHRWINSKDLSPFLRVYPSWGFLLSCLSSLIKFYLVYMWLLYSWTKLQYSCDSFYCIVDPHLACLKLCLSMITSKPAQTQNTYICFSMWRIEGVYQKLRFETGTYYPPNTQFFLSVMSPRDPEILVDLKSGQNLDLFPLERC